MGRESMTLQFGKIYIYMGDTEICRNRKCKIVDLWEYKENPTPKAIVLIKFLHEKMKWAVRTSSLKEVLK